MVPFWGFSGMSFKMAVAALRVGDNAVDNDGVNLGR
jgi:hypothetical protein